MYSANENNAITKEMALNFMRDQCRSDRNYVIEALIGCTLYGREYPKEQRYGRMEMSYFCRAFNITEYDASKQKNRIKGRYKKYAQIPDIEEYFRSVLQKQWPGYPAEGPRMDDVLRDFANGTAASPDSKTGRETGKGGYPYSDYSRKPSPVFSSGSWDMSLLRKAAGPVLVLFLAVLLLRSCGRLESTGASAASPGIFSSIRVFFIKVLSMIIAFVILAVPAAVFVVSRVWRDSGKLVIGLVSYAISWSCFSSGVQYSVLFGCVFWLVGVLVWRAAK